MDNLVLFIVSLVLFVTLYYYIIKINKQTYEKFIGSTSADSGDIVPDNQDELNDLIKKHQVDYSDILYDMNYLFTQSPQSFLTNKIISFWSPMTNNTIHSLGTAVSDSRKKPTNLYTAAEGSELINPIGFESILKFGETNSSINIRIQAIDNRLTTLNTLVVKIQQLLTIYDNPDQSYHIAKIWNSRDTSRVAYLVPDIGIFNSQTSNSLFTSVNRDQFHDKFHFEFMNMVYIPSHMVITIRYPIQFNGNWTWYTDEFSGSTYNNIKSDLLNNQNYNLGTNVLGRTTIRPEGTAINLNEKINTLLQSKNIDFTRVSLQNERNMDIYVIKDVNFKNYWTNQLNTTKQQITTLNQQKQNFSNVLANSFSIWKPIVPTDYKAFGYILVKGLSQPVISSMKCVPTRCTKETRNWKLTDKIMVYQKDGIRYNLFKNPFHQTFEIYQEKLVNNRWVPNGTDGDILEQKILRIYPCIPECKYVDSLIESDKCAQNMCLNKRKIHQKSTPLYHKQAEKEAEAIMLDDIKKQDLLLENLKKVANEIESNHNKFDIVTKEFNRSKFNKYIGDTKYLHENTINKLFKTKDSVAVNINSPWGIQELKNMLKDELVNYAKKIKNIPVNNQQNPGTKNLPPGCTNWSEFKQNYRCKYSDPPCFGCVNPN